MQVVVIRMLFAATVFTAAALVFLVQPMVAKQLLPAFGGTPAVWNTTVVFFQVVQLDPLRDVDGWRALVDADADDAWTDDSSDLASTITWLPGND